jgi:hypothetical protein
MARHDTLVDPLSAISCISVSKNKSIYKSNKKGHMPDKKSPQSGPSLSDAGFGAAPRDTSATSVAQKEKEAEASFSF